MVRNTTGTQMTQWDFQNKGKLGWTVKSSFVLKVPLRHLRPSGIPYHVTGSCKGSIEFTPPISTFAELFRSKVGRKIKTNRFLVYDRHAIHTHEVPRKSQAI